jgi:hypothetical protein
VYACEIGREEGGEGKMERGEKRKEVVHAA